jgi:hypothetical protein
MKKKPEGQLLVSFFVHYYGFFRSEVHWDEGFDLAAKAKEPIEQAIEFGILTKAEESAGQFLSSFFEHLGYRSTIRFE